jgi:ELWxxDGT repeat protein
VFFLGTDSSDDPGLWVTNGTAAGTHELTGISGASMIGISGLRKFRSSPQKAFFNNICR